MEKKQSNDQERFFEIDVARGIAIVLMVIFHFLFDLNFFYKTDIDLQSGFFRVLQIIIGFMFVFIVGISLSISFNKKNASFLRFFRRGLIVFAFGMIITVGTKLFFPDDYIAFGVLHMIGVSIILAYFFRKFRIWNLLFGIGIILIGIYLNHIYFSSNTWLPFGLITADYTSVDYYPLFPWFGVVLLGMYVGGLLYDKDNKRKFKIKDISSNILIKGLVFLGKYSLIIYMVHQIILFGGLWVILKIV